MPAYIVAFYDVVDPDGYRGYVPGVIPLLQKHGAEVLVADYESQALEGEKHSACIVLKFASEAAALAWYNDPDYALVRKLRVDSCGNTSLALAKGLVRSGT
jgi:uncharacterized protein (DUF1330 family)